MPDPSLIRNALIDSETQILFLDLPLNSLKKSQVNPDICIKMQVPDVSIPGPTTPTDVTSPGGIVLSSKRPRNNLPAAVLPYFYTSHFIFSGPLFAHFQIKNYIKPHPFTSII